MSPALFEPAIPGRERPQTQALGGADIGIGQHSGCFQGSFCLIFLFIQKLHFIPRGCWYTLNWYINRTLDTGLHKTFYLSIKCLYVDTQLIWNCGDQLVPRR